MMVRWWLIFITIFCQKKNFYFYGFFFFLPLSFGLWSLFFLSSICLWMYMMWWWNVSSLILHLNFVAFDAFSKVFVLNLVLRSNPLQAEKILESKRVCWMKKMSQFFLPKKILVVLDWCLSFCFGSSHSNLNSFS